jgi:histone acetyltransferase
MIPGIQESGWDYEKDYLPLTKNEQKLDFITQCRNIINKIKEEKSSQPFLYPVNREQVVDYYEIIKDPMDLQTLENNLDLGNYKDKNSFKKDLLKIFENSKKYNKPSTFYYKSAKELENLIEPNLRNLRDD